MRIVRKSEWRISTWKNGLGRTAEISIHPPRANLSDFDWRISIATVEAGGPFSEFPGIDRVMAILSGNGILLQIGSSAPTRVTTETEPISFSGDVSAMATLLGSTVTDLNLMVRRRAGMTPSIRKLVLNTRAILEAGSYPLAVYLQSGSATAGGTARLDAGDTLVFPDSLVVPVELSGNATLFVLSR